MIIKHHFGYDSQFEINLGVCDALKNYNIISLHDFNLLFQKNDINVLADIFLNLTPDFNGLMYEYDRISEVFSNNWAKKETLEENRRQYNEIMNSITAIYARLFKELPEKQGETMAAFTNLITIANIVNYRIIQFDGTPMDIKPYLQQFSDNKTIQDAVFIEAVLQQRDAYKEGSNTDYTNDIYEHIFNRMATDVGISEKKLQEAYKEHEIIKNGSQQDLVDFLITKI